jgi:hypothetical protein
MGVRSSGYQWPIVGTDDICAKRSDHTSSPIAKLDANLQVLRSKALSGEAHDRRTIVIIPIVVFLVSLEYQRILKGLSKTEKVIAGHEAYFAPL